MNIETQIKKTVELVENRQLSQDVKLILENQLVILETLKKLVVKMPHVSDIVPM